MAVTPPPKRALCEELLAGGMIMVVLDARREGVNVPPMFAADPSLRLNLSWRFGTPMTIDEWGVHATLSFDGVPFACALPWPSIYVLFSHTSGKPYVFPEDVPSEAIAAAGSAGRPELHVVRDATAAVVEAPDDGVEPDPCPPRKSGHLRVVK